MKKLLLSTAVLIMFLLFNQTIAQDKWSLEFRPGVNYATKDISDADLELGFGTKLTIAYRLCLILPPMQVGVTIILQLINPLQDLMQALKKTVIHSDSSLFGEGLGDLADRQRGQFVGSHFSRPENSDERAFERRIGLQSK